jgi:hypothetical protein
MVDVLDEPALIDVGERDVAVRVKSGMVAGHMFVEVTLA